MTRLIAQHIKDGVAPESNPFAPDAPAFGSASLDQRHAGHGEVPLVESLQAGDRPCSTRSSSTTTHPATCSPTSPRPTPSSPTAATSMSAVGVGIIGVGVISDTYLENLNSFPDVEVLVVGDLIADRARSQAEKHGIPAHGSGPDVLAHRGVELVVNLTTPDAHIEVTSDAIAAGKHVWSEKPLGLDRDGAAALLEQAKAAGVRIGSAPDTLLGPGFQSARRAIAAGVIGEPMFAQTAFQTQGPDLWHPNPGFLFAQGAGPLLDMGPHRLLRPDQPARPRRPRRRRRPESPGAAGDPYRPERRFPVPGGGAAGLSRC